MTGYCFQIFDRPSFEKRIECLMSNSHEGLSRMKKEQS